MIYQRLIAFLLVSSLLANSALASVPALLYETLHPSAHTISVFNEQALEPSAAWEVLPIGKFPWSRGEASRVEHSLETLILFAGQSSTKHTLSDIITVILGRPIPELPPEIANSIIEVPEIGQRAFNSLKKADIRTVGKILSKTKAEMLLIDGFGSLSLNKVETFLARLLETAQPRIDPKPATMFDEIVGTSVSLNDMPAEIAKKKLKDFEMSISANQQLKKANIKTVKDYLSKTQLYTMEYLGRNELIKINTLITNFLADAWPHRIKDSDEDWAHGSEGSRAVSKAFEDPQVLALFQEEAGKFGFTRFRILSAEDPFSTRKLIGVKFTKGPKTLYKYQATPDLLGVYRHFAEALSQVYKKEILLDSQTPQTRALVTALLRTEKARVNHSGPLIDSLESKVKDQDQLRDLLASQSYEEISPANASVNDILQDISRYIWFTYIFRSRTYRESHSDEKTFKNYVILNVRVALEIDFPWLNPRRTDDIVNRILDLDKSLDPFDLAPTKEVYLFAGQSSTAKKSVALSKGVQTTLSKKLAPMLRIFHILFIAIMTIVAHAGLGLDTKDLNPQEVKRAQQAWALILSQLPANEQALIDNKDETILIQKRELAPIYEAIEKLLVLPHPLDMHSMSFPPPSTARIPNSAIPPVSWIIVVRPIDFQSLAALSVDVSYEIAGILGNKLSAGRISATHNEEVAINVDRALKTLTAVSAIANTPRVVNAIKDPSFAAQLGKEIKRLEDWKKLWLAQPKTLPEHPRPATPLKKKGSIASRYIESAA